MKYLLATLAFCSMVVPSFAARIIVKNAKNLEALQVMADVQTLKSFDLGENAYTVLETGTSGLQIAEAVLAEGVFYDVPIYIPETKDHPEAAGTAWHVDQLQYDKLPNTRGKEIVVAVLDTGVDYTHKALAPVMWKNKGEIAGNGIDDDNNGFIDDVVGYDFTGDNDSDPQEGFSDHGTHCAGIVAAKKQENGNAQGVATQAKIMAVRIIGGPGAGFLSDAAEGVKYAVDNGAHILTNSWRIYSSWSSYYNKEAVELLRNAIVYAEKKDVLFVAAAGNERRDNDKLLQGMSEEIIPTGFTGLSNLFVVASAAEKETKSSFTNYGAKSVAISAPGSNILSTVKNNRWGSKSGTSMATPLVAGALARGLSKGMTPSEATKAIMDTSNKSELWDSLVQSGHINLMEFLK